MAKKNTVTRVTVADRHMEPARRDERFVPATVELMQQHDITLGFAGPFYQLERPLVETAICIHLRRP